MEVDSTRATADRAAAMRAWPRAQGSSSIRSLAATRICEHAACFARVRLRPTDAIGAQVGHADFGMDPKDQLDRVGKVELKIEMASLAVGVVGDRLERIGHLA